VDTWLIEISRNLRRSKGAPCIKDKSWGMNAMQMNLFMKSLARYT
jgi:hypothetical protein